MLKTLGKIGLAAAAGSTLMVGVASVNNSDVVPNGDTGQDSLSQRDDQATQETVALKTLPSVEGIFTFDQTSLSTNGEIKRALNDAAKYICGSQLVGDRAAEMESFLDWKINVEGAVGSQFTATLDELAEEGKARIIMGCSCAGNPAGGLSSVNADIVGITIESIMSRAVVDDSANTIVFTSSDGYEIALPLTYVKQRHSMIVYEINGESLNNSVGGANQLWLGSTSALYFARDIENIRFESRATAPPSPGTRDADIYANSPGIGITYSGA
jgi:DMSO/TMAO reductase YedYZ molybdopterin-dependent catalytic subunit